MNDLLLFLGMAALSAAFLSYGHPVLRRLGLLSVFATTFVAGYVLTDSLWFGAACAAAWLFLPWVEILLRVRKLRLPLRKTLRQVAPPSRDAFPELPALSSAVEDSGFEHVADLGWEMDGYRQFLRLFANAERREEAVITHVEQNHLGFHFASVSSRTTEGDVFTTWNCPVSSSLKTPPTVRLNRAPSEETFPGLLSAHRAFLARCGRGPEQMRSVGEEELRSAVERDMEEQMRHNMNEGVLRPADEGHGRYSWRGMLFLWFQFLRDILRFS